MELRRFSCGVAVTLVGEKVHIGAQDCLFRAASHDGYVLIHMCDLDHCPELQT